jgi:hypothetical protein
MDLKIDNLKYNENVFQVVQEKGADKKIVLKVHLKDSAPVGFLDEEILITNNSKHLETLPILVRANIEGPIRFEPAYIEFGALESQDVVSKTVKVFSSQKFNVEKAVANLMVGQKNVDLPPNMVKVSVNNVSDVQKEILIQLTNVSKYMGNIHGNILIETDHPKQREITVGFYGLLEKGE